MTIPKYVSNANAVLAKIAAEPDRVWDRTQRELCQEMGFSQPELSILIKILVNAGKVKKGDPLPGVRGRNFALEAIDTEPLAGAVRKHQPPAQPERHLDDRPLSAEEQVNGTFNLEHLSPEQLGSAVMRTIRGYWTKERQFEEAQSNYLAKIRDIREELTIERSTRMDLVKDRERLMAERELLRREIEERDLQVNDIREKLNALLIRDNRRTGSFTVRERLSEDEIKMLDSLMRAKPGHYRQSDRELEVG